MLSIWQHWEFALGAQPSVIKDHFMATAAMSFNAASTSRCLNRCSGCSGLQCAEVVVFRTNWYSRQQCTCALIHLMLNNDVCRRSCDNQPSSTNLHQWIPSDIPSFFYSISHEWIYETNYNILTRTQNYRFNTTIWICKSLIWIIYKAYDSFSSSRESIVLKNDLRVINRPGNRLANRK